MVKITEGVKNLPYLIYKKKKKNTLSTSDCFIGLFNLQMVKLIVNTPTRHYQGL